MLIQCSHVNDKILLREMHLTAGCHLPQKGKKKKTEMTAESKTLHQ